MIEDKQVYSTSRTAELERKYKEFINDFKSKIDKYNKERYRKKIAKAKAAQRRSEIQEASHAPTVVNLEKPSEENNKFGVEYKTISLSKEKMEPEKLHFIVTLTLFVLILFIMALGIYLPYRNR